MSKAFVWFHHSSDSPSDSVSFYEKLLAWAPSEGPPGMTMFAGDDGPFAAVGENHGVQGWIPFAEVSDVDEATKRAERLGAEIVKPKTRGPAGQFAILRDPGGAALALWQKA